MKDVVEYKSRLFVTSDENGKRYHLTRLLSCGDVYVRVNDKVPWDVNRWRDLVVGETLPDDVQLLCALMRAA